MINRRKFITQTTTLAATIAALKATNGFAAVPYNQSYTVQQVIDLILREGKITAAADTVDTIKAGDPTQAVTGIVTTMFATVEVIKQAAKLNANFIIAHEPTFYNHADDKDLVPDNPIVKEKLDLLNRYKIAVWRFHDGLHAMSPDPVGVGFLQKTGWTKYYGQERYTINIPPLSVPQLVAHLKKSLGIAHLRVVGDLTQSCKRLTILPGASGAKKQMTNAIKDNADVLIVGEVAEWETAEFFHDSNLLGHKKTLIVLGHSFSEEPGMEYLTTWLQPKLKGVNITHIASGEPFAWM
ncbi:MAG: Nif3-like dinuclear metal center hexameric protein [Mucilaginibacter sp.]|nr:Nif3-like dinuclear metal center hexameric protein [Mucilaginibacter sp.]